MTPAELQVLGSIFADACGFRLREELAFVAVRRLTPRLEALSLADFGAYAQYLAKTTDELETAIELVMPHETYFFRDAAQLDAFSSELIPRLERERASVKSLRVLSAGCATGEEAYSLAALLTSVPSLAGWQLEVLGVDLSRRALEVARRAEYGQASLRATDQAQRRRFFEPTAEGLHQVVASLRRHVRFGWANLVETAHVDALPMADVICLRNVLIYFDVPTRLRVLEALYRRLRPGGYLLLGHAENLLTLTTQFTPVRLEKDLVYRRQPV